MLRRIMNMADVSTSQTAIELSAASVAKCHGSWVVGRGSGSWVNVVGKLKKFSGRKNINIKLNNKSCKIHESKISVYIPGVLFLFPAVTNGQ